MRGFDKKYKNFPDFILKITKQIWEGKDVNSIADFYTNDIPVRSPFGVTPKQTIIGRRSYLEWKR